MKRMDTINVIPFIDIMLVLFAIVLTTATFLAEGRLEIRLPKAEAAPKTALPERIEVAVAQDGAYYLDGTRVELAPLAARLSTLSQETAVVLRVDAGARFEWFVAIVDLLKARGLERVSILTRDR